MPTQTSHHSHNGAIASGHELTTKAGIETLAAGGNAIDAAIACAFMSCVCEPVLASPAGAGFAMIRTRHEKADHDEADIELVDFFAQTPRQKNTGPIDFSEITADFGTATQTFHIGHASAATPGFLPGLLTLHEKHARLGLDQLTAPAIKAARDGFAITDFQYFLSTVVAPILLATDESTRLFAPGGILLQAGQHFANPSLGDFFEQVARHGSNAMPLAQILSAQRATGHLRRDDFDNYQVQFRQPLKLSLPGGTAFVNPPPSSGGALVAIALDALENMANPQPVDLAKALHCADLERTRPEGKLQQLLGRAAPPAFRGTTHISVVDNDGHACALTLSNGEGNGHMVGDCGFMMNNMLGEADINPGGARGWPTDSRMSSMMCPTIIETEKGAVFALGSGGSNRIRSTIFQVLANLLMTGLDVEQAVTAPRLHVENGHLDFEPLRDQAATENLLRAFPDHRQWRKGNMFFGGCHIAGLSATGQPCGIGDARRAGAFAAL